MALGDEEGLPNPNPTGFPRLLDPGCLPKPAKSGAAVELALAPAPEEDSACVVTFVEALVLVPPNAKPVVLEEDAAGLLSADGL